MRFAFSLRRSPLLLVSACATIPAANDRALCARAIPSTPLELGDWRGPMRSAVTQHFEREVASATALGLPLTAISADLRRNDFSCAANRDSAGRGDPPDQICRRTVSADNCTHTWQVHLFDADGDGALARTRALYDRRCGGDGLLGGPG